MNRYTKSLVVLSLGFTIATSFSVSLPGTALAATAAKLKIASSATAAKVSSKVTLTGTLLTSSNKVISGKTVRLERHSGSAWVLVKSIVTNSKGKVAIAVQPATTTNYRYRYTGSTKYRTCTSATKVVGGYTVPSQSWSGSGEQAVPIELSSGLAVFSVSSGQTDSNFIVWLCDSNGTDIDLLANTVGQCSDSVAVNVPSTGKYFLSVEMADTTWRVVATEPRQLSAPATTSFSGSGVSATSLFTMSKGAYKFTWSNTGTDNFIVWLLDRNGKTLDLIANKIGSSSGSHLVSVPSSGQYVLSVESDGPWSVHCAKQ